ncbi:hypothetical protein ABT56_01265 [Photobacterium aquae]|uniref:Chemotaxis protein n=1 Tax=Photobacterium aquae TaxID=1195763 RepID=A0A0J1K388_9GAMM|nr:DUF2884 family protein [Photobacterium aquae]KLV08877.1 hypothetical protein ABT56_01265 [Photobacterium aquae]
MKKYLLSALIGANLFSLSASANAQTQTCPIDVQNDIHIVGKTVEVYQNGKPIWQIDDEYQLFVNGEKVDLTALQQEAIEAYSLHVQSELPKLPELTQKGAELAHSAINALGQAFGETEAFASVNQLINEYSTKAKAKFYQDGEFVMPADTFSVMDKDWRQEFEAAMDNVSLASASAIFSALTNEMKKGELSFGDFKGKMSELEKTLNNDFKANTEQVKKEAESVCGSMQSLAQEEKALHEMIPELKNYPMFEI